VTRVNCGWHSVRWIFASNTRSGTREQGCSSWGATVLGCTCGALNCRVSRAESVADAKDSSIITVLSLADTTLVVKQSDQQVGKVGGGLSALTELREVV
jgi:hypothetical protein